jgi:flagellar basal body-associated protein FliL
MKQQNKLPVIVKIMLVALVYLLVCVSLNSCDILKESKKAKKDIARNSETFETIVNKGGVISSDILSENKRSRDKNGKIIDTVIVIKKDEITKTIYYRPDGSVTTSVQCPETFITKKEFQEFTDNSKYKENKKEEKFDSSFIIYAILGIVLLVIVVLLFIAWQFKGVIKSINKAAEKAV